MKRISKLGSTVIAMGLVAGVTLGFAAPAMAASQSGSRTCTGTRAPVLTLNTSGGSGTWTNANNVSQATVFTFLSGVQQKGGAYQAVNWVANSNNFFATTTSTCA